MANTDNTAQIGVNAVETVFLSMGWIFRRQLESDIGIDAHVEPVVEEDATGQLIALQIKSGLSYFRKRGAAYVYYGEPRHLAYWERHALPLILILHNPKTGEMLWTRVERHRARVTKNGSWSIEISPHAKLTVDSAQTILDSLPKSDPESTRRQRMALDVDLIRRASEEGEAYLRIEEWINKSLNFRGAEICFGDPDATAEFDIPFYASSRSLALVLDALFPWADHTYTEPPKNYSGEVDVHTLAMTVNELGKAFLLLEDFYCEGPTPREEPAPPTEEEWSEEEWSEAVYARMADRDYE